MTTKRAVLLGLVLVVATPVGASARGDRGGDQGNGNDQERCERAQGDCRGSFSPGPFKDSPVTIIICPPGTQQCGNGQPSRSS